MKRYVSALTIAGSDPSGGAGLQADLKTFSALGVYGAAVVTAVTVQNTVGVKYVHALPPQVVYDQIVAVMEDIRPDAVKIGMVNDAVTLDAVVRALEEFRPKYLVVDPVMVSSSVDDAARAIMRLGVKALLIKGGHAEGRIKTDNLYLRSADGVKRIDLTADTVDTVNTHGTGCTLSSAIAAMLARGCGMEEAVRSAKLYLTEALKAGADVTVGSGHGPVCHFYDDTVMGVLGSTVMRSGLITVKTYNLKTLSQLQFITHFTDKYSYFDSAMMALEGGCRWIQLRMKDTDETELERVARLILPECRRRGAVFIIDDNVDVALRVGADGVHLGKNDMPVDEARRILGNGFIIGGTANTFEDVKRLAAQGADYIGCGPFRFTTTKKNLAPMLGVDGYRTILEQMSRLGIKLPLVAIGGITDADIPVLMAAGVTGIALSGSVLRAENPVGEMNKIVKIIMKS